MTTPTLQSIQVPALADALENVIRFATADRQEIDLSATFTPTSDEYNRASRLRLAEPRADFLHSRGLARVVIAQQLSSAHADMALETDADGAPLSPADGLSASWSRTGPVALAGVAHATALGCDIETVRDVPVAAMLATIAGEEEAATVLAQPDQNLAFFRLWTLKEALLKAARCGFRAHARDTAIPAGLIEGEADGAHIFLGTRWHLAVRSSCEQVYAFAAQR